MSGNKWAKKEKRKEKAKSGSKRIPFLREKKVLQRTTPTKVGVAKTGSTWKGKANRDEMPGSPEAT